MKLKTLMIIIATIAGVNHLAVSQDVGLPKIIPSSPEATNLIRNIQYPVSYAHGSVDISIPLYEIVVGDLVIPISLSYNHKGLRPLEFTPYLGQGWSLRAEPSISRKPNGQPDKGFKYVFPGDNNPYSPASWGYKNQLLTGQIDAYPDEYYYNIPGKSGAFVFKNPAPNSGVAVFPFEPIRVEHSNEYFTITDDDGTIYSFGLRDNTDNSPAKPANSWKCTSITTPKGNATFTYWKDSDVVSRSINEIVIIDDRLDVPDPRGVPDMYKDLPQVFQWKRTTDGTGTISTDTRGEFHLVKREVEGESQYWEFEDKKESSYLLGGIQEDKYNIHRIQNIDFPGGRVSFLTSQENTLEYILIYNDDDELIRRIHLFHNKILYEYRGISSPVGNSNYPILKSVTITGGGIDEKYDFEYYNRGNGSSDHNFPYLGHNGERPTVNFWGYWTIPNSAEVTRYVHRDWYSVNFQKGTNTIFTDPYYFFIGTGNRLGKVVNNGILKTITTKSGSQTTFDYESDKFEREEITNELGNKRTIEVESGGLRIKKIIQHDGDPAKAVERHFEYGPPVRVWENGVWKDKPSGVGHTVEQITADLFTTTYLYCDVNRDHTNWRRRIISGNLPGDMTFSGVPIVYSYVTEYTKGYVQGTLQNFGKTVRHYNYANPGTSSRIEGTGLAFDNVYRSWAKDYLKAEIIYRYDGIENGTEKWTKLRSSRNFYAAFSQEYIPALLVWKTMDYMSGHHRHEMDVHYRWMSPGSQVLSRSVDSLFLNSGGHVATMTVYEYNDGTDHKNNQAHLYPLSVSTMRSDETVQTHSFKYVKDASAITDTEHRNAVTSMISKNILRPVIEQTESSGTHSRTISNLYTTSLSKSAAGLPVVQKLSVKDSSVSTAEDRIVYHNYDSFGNPLYATKDGVTNVVYLWDSTGQHLVAMIENATYSNVATALNTASLNSPTLNIGPANFDSRMSMLRSSPDLKSALITTFKYKPLIGITEITDPRGVKTTYDYDSRHRLKSISDEDGSKLKEYEYRLKGN